MAAVGADLSSLSAVLKEFYLGPLCDQLNQEVMVTQLLRVDSENLEGLKAVVPLHYGRSGGIGARAEGATLPSAGRQSYARAEYDLKYHYARIQVSGPSIAKTKSEAGSFLQAMKAELDFIRNDLQLDQARQYYGDGTGIICTVNALSGSVITTGAASNSSTVSAEAISKGYLYVGAVIDVGDAATPTEANGIQVIDVDISAGTITVDDASNVDTGDVIVRHGNVSDTTNAANVDEVDAGLSALIGTGVVGGIDPTLTGKKFWKSTVEDANTVYSSTSISLSMLMQHNNRLINLGARNADLTVMTTPGLVRRLFASTDFQNSVRFVNSTTLVGGFEELSFAAGNGPMKLNSDRLHPWGQVTFADKQRMRVFSPADWDFLSRDGLTIRWVSDVDAFQAILFRYLNLGTDRRNTSGKITGLTDTGF
jgi:hypothetical protein